jgi:hypothetical protein
MATGMSIPEQWKREPSSPKSKRAPTRAKVSRIDLVDLKQLSTLSDQEWVAYIKSHYPKQVAYKLIALHEASLAGREQDGGVHTKPRSKPKPRRKRQKGALGHGQSNRSEPSLTRWLAHAIVLLLAAAFGVETLRVALLVFALSLLVGWAVTALLQSLWSAVLALLARWRSGSRAASSPDISWDDAPTARFLNWAALVLPREYRSRFVEEQCGNLLACESSVEWLLYLTNQIWGLPRVAWTYHAERRRQAAK